MFAGYWPEFDELRLASKVFPCPDDVQSLVEVLLIPPANCPCGMVRLRMFLLMVVLEQVLDCLQCLFELQILGEYRSNCRILSNFHAC
ncbi:hypothetical protein Pelo_5408 [Pelomyxa schiedti]|nr:hypothetical protein Pelo_5408 [Pelomyxa schiedti]